jgi:hypothetical protein
MRQAQSGEDVEDLALEDTQPTLGTAHGLTHGILRLGAYIVAETRQI